MTPLREYRVIVPDMPSNRRYLSKWAEVDWAEKFKYVLFGGIAPLFPLKGVTITEVPQPQDNPIRVTHWMPLPAPLASGKEGE